LHEAAQDAQRSVADDAAEISDSLCSTTDLAAMIDIAPPKPGKRGMYKKAIAA
jgi:hypothetical protein